MPPQASTAGQSGSARIRSGAGLLLLAVVVLVATACSGTTESAPPTDTSGRATTPTSSETTPLEQDRAYLLAYDFCTNAPLASISLIQGGSPEEVARDFASEIRPELREAALQGCLAALEED